MIPRIDWLNFLALLMILIAIIFLPAYLPYLR